MPVTSSSISLKEAAPLFATSARMKALAAAFGKAGSSRKVRINGLAGSAPAMLFSSLERGRQPYLIICDDFDAAGYMVSDLASIAGQEAVAILPSGFRRGLKYGQPDPPQQILRAEALDAWTRKTTRWIVSYPEALAEKVPRKQEIQENTVTLKKGENKEMSAVRDRLLELGFREVDYVYEPGQFARRGSLLDVFSYSNELPFRVDFFDDEIDSIRTFNVETQLSETKVEEINITPEFTTRNDTDGISFLDFIEDGTVLLCSDCQLILERVRAVAEEEFSASGQLTGEGDASAMRLAVDAEAFARRFRSFTCAEFGIGQSLGTPDAVLDFKCRPQGLFHKNFDLLSSTFDRFEEEGYKLLVLSDSERQTDRLHAILEDRGDKVTFQSVTPTLHEGFSDEQSKLAFFTDHQIFDRFHKFHLRSDRARSGKLALNLKELSQIEPGDFIVHIDHGIGRFGGLVRTNVNGHTQEMIKLIYQNDDIIFVSIHALHKLSKYRAKEGVAPRINKLGTGAWARMKDRTKAKMKDIARDLIRLYSARKQEKGFPFSPDSYLQHELEASFVYEDTPDQLKATQAVKEDMESAKPMDRLICGDVGFGKTEIAIRAAFKAAADNKQTAVLVPTTVLALQHYQTFSKRLADLPVRVEFISRARKPKEVKQVLQDLKEGKVDILIGTHKILGKTVEFKDLGLLVIDEEQKFGVAVKEKLKQMKVNVDTLTMSATPIPRTLQFSLMGARDLSALNTPPSNRHPIITNVADFSDEVVREAIDFEVSRNGQVFFVSNRIENLYDLQAVIQRTNPGVRTVVAHGQMPPEKMEQAIVDFANHDYDVLLSTTIIENGIDMPNVNTILVNNAHHFGLSELHQLRGRVGRSDRKAFCYLLIPPKFPLTPDARRRLQAIESFSDLGSGIQIAMQDLDIRGAGNLLGAEQSGFIADLGYEAYQKILKESVMELKTEEFADTFAEENRGDDLEFTSDCTIESDMELLLPATYVPQENERISLYKELDNMEREDQVEEFRERLSDRFGAIPKVSEELIKIVPLRMKAKRLGIERLTLKNNRMYAYFVNASNAAYYQSKAFGRVLGFVQKYTGRSQFRKNEEEGKCSILFSDVPDVSSALKLITEITEMP